MDEGYKSSLPNDLQHLADALPDTLLRSKAAGTVSGYVSSIKVWTSFATRYNMTVFPTKAMDLSIFFLHLMETKQSSHSIVNTYHALKWAHELVGKYPQINPLETALIKYILETSETVLASQLCIKCLFQWQR